MLYSSSAESKRETVKLFERYCEKILSKEQENEPKKLKVDEWRKIAEWGKEHGHIFYAKNKTKLKYNLDDPTEQMVYDLYNQGYRHKRIVKDTGLAWSCVHNLIQKGRRKGIIS